MPGTDFPAELARMEAEAAGDEPPADALRIVGDPSAFIASPAEHAEAAYQRIRYLLSGIDPSLRCEVMFAVVDYGSAMFRTAIDAWEKSIDRACAR